MIHYKTEMVAQQIIDKCECDNCHKIILPSIDFVEWQEMVHINQACGYGSIFGDMRALTCDLCQHCIKLLLGSVIRID